MTSDKAKSYSMRPMGLEDIDRIAHWFVDFDDVALFERELPVPVSPEHMRETWKKALEFCEPPKALWFLAEDGHGKPAGVCGLQSINFIHGDAVVPIFVEGASRGQGLAIAMSVSVIDLAFDMLRLHRLTTFFRDDNAATDAITKKTGFKEEGRLREAWYADGKHRDVVQVGLLKADWISLGPKLRDELHEVGKVSIVSSSNCA